MEFRLRLPLHLNSYKKQNISYTNTIFTILLSSSKKGSVMLPCEGKDPSLSPPLCRLFLLKNHGIFIGFRLPNGNIRILTATEEREVRIIHHQP